MSKKILDYSKPSRQTKDKAFWVHYIVAGVQQFLILSVYAAQLDGGRTAIRCVAVFAAFWIFAVIGWVKPTWRTSLGYETFLLSGSLTGVLLVEAIAYLVLVPLS